MGWLEKTSGQSWERQMTAQLALTILIGLNLGLAAAACWGVRVIGRELGLWD